MPPDTEIMMTRDRMECLVRELTAMLKVEPYYQFKIRIEGDTIRITPHSASVEIKW